MLSVTDATARVGQHARPLPAETIPLTEAAGRVLREAIHADRPFPPFDRVAMDGIALRYSDVAAGQRRFNVVGQQRAGEPPQSLPGPTTLVGGNVVAPSVVAPCLEVMTGAVLPTGADTVVRYEDVVIDHPVATLTIDNVVAGQHVHRQGTDRAAGALLLGAGAVLTPAAVAVAASVGRGNVVVSRLPSVALVSTGDELVDVAAVPLPHQIRRSNTFMLQAALRQMGISAPQHHLPDHEATLRHGLAELLAETDIVVLSGGVSAGKADYVPAVLASLGVERVFHQVAQRPGKPLWFGVLKRPAGGQTAVFGLPGNPVSTFLCFERYVRPFLRAQLGAAPLPVRWAQLAEATTFRPTLTYFLPVRLHSVPQPTGGLLAYPLPGSGSADFANLLDADAFLELPPEVTTFPAGSVWPVVG